MVLVPLTAVDRSTRSLLLVVAAQPTHGRTWLKPQLSHSQRVEADQKPSFSGLAAKRKTAPPVSVEEDAG
jgi:hypothetical protein